MTPQIVKVQANSDYSLLARFKNGEKRLFNMIPYLDRNIFQELKNMRYFKKVRIIWGGIEWPHKQDLSTDTLYYEGTRIKKFTSLNTEAYFRKRAARANIPKVLRILKYKRAA